MALVQPKQINGILSTQNVVPRDASTFIGGIGAWTTYADAAGQQPVDGTGGSPNVTIARTTVSAEVLNGTASLKFSKDAVNRQGQGASLDITVPNYIKGLPCKVKFSAKGSANFDFGTAFDSADPSDITVYLYDVTNSRLIQPYPYTIDSNFGYEGTFQVPTDCATLRLILHVTTTNALAYDLFLDDVQIVPAANETVAADSDWQSYTPTFTGLGTVTGINMQYRKVGDSIELLGRFTAGTGTATEARMSLPAGLISLSTLGVLIKVGSGSTTETPTAAYSLAVLCEPSVSYVTFGATSSVASEFSKRTGNSSTLSGQTIAVNARIPIQGWTSGQVTAASANLNAPVVFRAYKNGGTVNNAAIATWTGVNKDTVSGFNSTTGIYTVKVPGDYSVGMVVGFTTTTNEGIQIHLNGVSYAAGSATGNGVNARETILPDLKVGDTISFVCNGNKTFSSADTTTYAYLSRVETSNRVYSTRVAYVKDVKANNTSGGSSTSGSYQTRTLNTLEGDTSFISLASNQFTLQPGTYYIEAEAPFIAPDAGSCISKIKLRNITGATDVIIGQTGYVGPVSGAGENDGNSTALMGEFSITSATVFEIQQRVSASRATSGYGGPANFGDSEVYTQVKIEKVL